VYDSIINGNQKIPVVTNRVYLGTAKRKFNVLLKIIHQMPIQSKNSREEFFLDYLMK